MRTAWGLFLTLFLCHTTLTYQLDQCQGNQFEGLECNAPTFQSLITKDHCEGSTITFQPPMITDESKGNAVTSQPRIRTDESEGNVIFTDPSAVRVLQGLFSFFKRPKQLKFWRSDGGDPCKESWTGVQCAGSSVTHLKLRGLNLTGRMWFQLIYLSKLEEPDLSANMIGDEIPFSLPRNLRILNLAGNKFNGSLPMSLRFLKRLQYLNLSHNYLYGPLVRRFGGMSELRVLDLSFNQFRGDLPHEFSLLKNLSHLYLQGNRFIGSVAVLGSLPIVELDLSFNDFDFDGDLPKEIRFPKNITHLNVQINGSTSSLANLTQGRNDRVISVGSVVAILTHGLDDTVFVVVVAIVLIVSRYVVKRYSLRKRRILISRIITNSRSSPKNQKNRMRRYR